MLRVPSALLDLRTAREYCDGESAFVRRAGNNVVLRWSSEDEDGEEDWGDGEPGPLGALVGVRADLAAGDLRPLYLGWLAALGAGFFGTLDDFGGEDEGGVLEPAVPAGLGRLTGAQRALADFLRVDADLLAVAAEASGEVGAGAKETASAVDQFVKGLTSEEKDAALRRLLSEDDPHARGTAGRRPAPGCQAAGERAHGACAARGRSRPGQGARAGAPALPGG
jgi:hypothetical protein